MSDSLPEDEEHSTFNASLGPLAEAPGLSEPASTSNDSDLTLPWLLQVRMMIESEDEDADFPYLH